MRQALIVLMLLLVATGCSKDKDKSEAAEKRIYTHEQFHKEFTGATLTQVREKLGAPDEVDVAESRWEYHRRTKDAKTGKLDDVAGVYYKDDRVYQVSCWSRP